ncbi:DUF5856 family protein [Dysgonomonas sp. 25]|uniref:DUF5856 family protein n=1 Tax=Dysgonomonas sp. 25 TaxID=2302933 RepID=UPI0013D8A2B7|nr:DUF5856 family protein [Dysgonomonas sp. 25]NDV70427.1 hypothetical protein [Dysgonomonas sp. 25]
MSTTAEKKSKSVATNAKLGTVIGKMFSFNSSLKLFHWHVTGKASYAQHMALDQALEDLLDIIDRITETTYALNGDINIVIPETKTPTDIIKHASDFYDYMESQRPLFSEAMTQAIIDDYNEAIQQLLYRLKRLQ